MLIELLLLSDALTLALIVPILVFVIAILIGGDKVLDADKLARFNYFNPCDRYLTTGNQLCNGYIAMNNGGLFGKGLGNSTQKYLYLPEAYAADSRICRYRQGCRLCFYVERLFLWSLQRYKQ